MVSDLEKLSSGLRGDNVKDGAEKLAAKIKSDPQVRRDLDEKGFARIADDQGRSFVVKRKNAMAAAMSRM
jgi:hypothetical protein